MSGKHLRSESQGAPRPGTEHPARTAGSTHHDPYAARAKASDARVCDACGLVFHAGRWSRGTPPLTDVRGGLCPACVRVRDHDPAGTIRVPADFLELRDEVLGMIRNAAESETPEHPLERVMDVEDDADGGLVVTTTGIHLARAIANKLERRFHRQARFHYPEARHELLVDWEE